VRGEDASHVAVAAIPAQNGLAQQIIRHWQPFKDRKQTFAVSRRAEQLCLGAQQRIGATVEDSVTYRDGRPQVSGRGCPKECLIVQTHGMAWGDKATS
jgi:hypothetical protein